MSFNSFGRILRFTTFGESHGEALGCIIDGVPPNINLSEKIIQPFMDKRKPGQSKFVTQRKEDDKVKILSGVMNGKTLGSPIGIILENKDQKSKDYKEIATSFRPGHADFTYFSKYGIRDYRGGGRSSARETAMRVAAGAVAQQILLNSFKDFKIFGFLSQIGPYKINRSNIDYNFLNNNSLFCPDKVIIKTWEKFLNETRKNGSSTGAIIELQANGIPAGIGSPIYAKLDSDIASAIMSINAVKGVEIGSGFSLCEIPGTESSDEMKIDKNKKILFKSNHAGGILGGISTGQSIIVKFVVKPTSSILQPKNSITEKHANILLSTKGRHDPCVGIRAVPIGEAMLAFTIADLYLAHKAQIG